MPLDKLADDVEKLFSDEKSLADRKATLSSEEKSMEERKQALIADLLKQRDAANAAFDEKLAKLSNPGRRPGDKVPDGTIYAGISPDTGKKMYTTPFDAALTMTFNEAGAYAKKLNHEKYFGHDDWRMPTKAELNVLFNKQAAVGAFDASCTYPAGVYWSATPSSRWFAWCQRFNDGEPGASPKGFHLLVRCVRSDASP